MALIIKTNNPQKIADGFEKLVREHRILTWTIDEEGDYTIPKEQWYGHAWMRPITYDGNNTLIFGFISSTRYPVTKGLYGIYHGRLAATLLAHFDNDMENVSITPYMVNGIDY